ncbi:MAG: hypothetical protein NTY13_04005 [Chlamydiae bacterium]|nr:hypothetical protein [Chlamydiota bacterium]
MTALTRNSLGRVLKKWISSRKKEAVLRLLKGEAVDGLESGIGRNNRQIGRWKMEKNGSR